MPVVWDMDKRCHVVGRYKPETGEVIYEYERKHWRDILTVAEIEFMETYIKSKNMPSSDDIETWHGLHRKVLSEGWAGWRLVEGKIRGISLIPCDSDREPPMIPWSEWKKPKTKGPMADTLEGFIHED